MIWKGKMRDCLWPYPNVMHVCWMRVCVWFANALIGHEGHIVMIFSFQFHAVPIIQNDCCEFLNFARIKYRYILIHEQGSVLVRLLQSLANQSLRTSVTKSTNRRIFFTVYYVINTKCSNIALNYYIYLIGYHTV